MTAEKRKYWYRRIHAQLRAAGLADIKDELVYQFSDMHHTSMSQLTGPQLIDLCNAIGTRHAQKLRPVRKKVVHLLCSADPEKFTVPAPSVPAEDRAPSYEAINAWCSQRTKARKPLLEQSYVEITQTLREAQEYQNTQKAKNN